MKIPIRLAKLDALDYTVHSLIGDIPKLMLPNCQPQVVAYGHFLTPFIPCMVHFTNEIPNLMLEIYYKRPQLNNYSRPWCTNPPHHYRYPNQQLSCVRCLQRKHISPYSFFQHFKTVRMAENIIWAINQSPLTDNIQSSWLHGYMQNATLLWT